MNFSVPQFIGKDLYFCACPSVRPIRQSNMLISIFNATIGSEILRIAQATTKTENFKTDTDM